MQQAGRALASGVIDHNNRVSAERAELQREADAVYLAHTGAEWRSRWTADLQENLDKYDGQEPGFALGFSKRYHQEADALLQKTPERMRGKVELELIRQGEILISAADEGERGRVRAFAMNRLAETAETQAETIRVMPELFWDAVSADALEDLKSAAPSGRTEGGEGLGEAFVKEASGRYASAYADALLERDPGRLLDELEAGDLDPYISAGQKSNWMVTARGAFEKQELEAQQAVDRQVREWEAEANDLTARVKAFYSAGLAPPRDLLNAAFQANARVSDAGNDEAIELARYSANRGTKEDRKSAARSALSDLNDAFKLGLSPSAEMLETARDQVAASGSQDLMRELQDIEAMAGKRQEFAFMTPKQAEDRLADLRAAPATRETVRETELLTATIEAREKAIADGNLAGYLASNGVPMPALDPQADDFAENLVRRAVVMQQASAEFGGPLQIFGKGEAQRLARQSEAMDPDQWMATYGAMSAVLGPNLGAALEAISEHAPLDAQAALLATQGRTAATQSILAGRKAMKDNPKLAPKRSSADVMAAESEVIGAALPPELAAHRNEIGEAARAWYAAEQLRTGGDGEFDEAAYETALQVAAGRSGDKGGFGKVNGQRTLLPPHLSADDVQELIKSGEIFGRNSFRYSYGHPEIGRMGGPPAFLNPDGTTEVYEADELRGATLVAKAPGIYWVKLGGEYVVDFTDTDESGAALPFVLDLRRAAPPARSATSRYLDDPLSASRSR